MLAGVTPALQLSGTSSASEKSFMFHVGLGVEPFLWDLGLGRCLPQLYRVWGLGL